VLSEVENAAYDGLDRANVGIAAACKPNDFAMHTILLVGECERGEACLLNLLSRCSREGDACIANEELDVGQSKWVVVVVGVLAWAEKEEEGNNNHVGDSTEGSVPCHGCLC
jgi:hypothetical protein